VEEDRMDQMIEGFGGLHEDDREGHLPHNGRKTIVRHWFEYALKAGAGRRPVVLRLAMRHARRPCRTPAVRLAPSGEPCTSGGSGASPCTRVGPRSCDIH